jgi:hypothetical protein
MEPTQSVVLFEYIKVLFLENRLNWKRLSRLTNTLAYVSTASVTKKKRFITLSTAHPVPAGRHGSQVSHAFVLNHLSQILD